MSTVTFFRCADGSFRAIVKSHVVELRRIPNRSWEVRTDGFYTTVRRQFSDACELVQRAAAI